MKQLKFLKLYENYNESLYPAHDQAGRYITITVKENGIVITLTPEGKTELEDIGIEENKFGDLIDDIQGNSSWRYIHDLGQGGFGLTEAQGFIYGYDLADDGEYLETEDSSLYYYNEYMLNDFVEILYKNGSVFFNKA